MARSITVFTFVAWALAAVVILAVITFPNEPPVLPSPIPTPAEYPPASHV